MPQITYITTDGGQHDVDVSEGSTVMEGAIDNMIEGILAECGGSCTCATCHVYVDDAWLDKIEGPGEFEKDLLEMVVDPSPNSRLSCQITVSAKLEGLVVKMPKSQF